MLFNKSLIRFRRSEFLFSKKISCKVSPINWKQPAGSFSINPSICRFNGKLYSTVRVFEQKGILFNNATYLLELNPNLEVLSSQRILLPRFANTSRTSNSFGFEDPRLFVWKNSLHTISTIKCLDDLNVHRMVVSKIDTTSHSYSFVDNFVVHPKHISYLRHEKNWMPVVKEDELFFVYSHDPLIIIDINGKIVPHNYKGSFSEFRGGSCLLPFFDGYLSVIHERIENPKIYSHRFIFYDKDFFIKQVSKPFHFLKRGIEFVAGICYADECNLLITFGFKDEESKIAKINLGCVFDLLEDSNGRTN
jgi:hypothetical protein